MLEWWGPVIYEYYGATEGGGTLVTPEEWLERPGSVGRPWAKSEWSTSSTTTARSARRANPEPST